MHLYLDTSLLVGLRSGDALHLAIAERHGLTVCTLYLGMSAAALALGFPCVTQ